MPKSVPLSRSGSVRSMGPSGLSRDGSYYFQDGNAVLLVGNVLFKLHSSLLARESEMFSNMFTAPTRLASSMSLDTPNDVPKKGKEGSCDENPIIIPQVQPQPFRHFLLVIYGRPGDKDYRSLFVGAAQLESLQVITTFIRLIDIVDLAHRFIAAEVETWALSQLKDLCSRIETLNAYPISSRSYLRLLNYAKRISDPGLILWTRHWTRSYYAWAIESSSVASAAFGANPVQKIRDQLVRDYKLTIIQQSSDSPIFGYLFCFLLSLGQEFWNKHPVLTREDRITLLGAQVNLTPLPRSTIPLNWLDTGRVVNGRSGLRAELRLCQDCHFSRTWRHNFGGAYREMIESTAPLGGVFALTMLPHRRQKFADETKHLSSRTCSTKCREVCLEFIDRNLDAVFTRLAEFCKKVE